MDRAGPGGADRLLTDAAYDGVSETFHGVPLAVPHHVRDRRSSRSAVGPRGRSANSGARPDPDCVPPKKPAVTPDESLDHTFTDQLGPGWVGGDATYSTELPDGQTAFVFSDTLIGRATPSGSARISGIAHNSELLGTLPSLRSDYAGSYSHPDPLIPDDRGDGDQWQVAATFVEQGRQLVFVNEFHPRRGPFARFTGRSAIAVLTLQEGTPTFSSLVVLPTSPRTQWGNAAMQQGPYTYVYGTVGDSHGDTFLGMKLARVRSGDALHPGKWRFWGGSGWEAREARAAIVRTGNELTGVLPQTGRSGDEAVSIPGSVLTDKTVDLSYACTPQGPWSEPAPVYSIPQIRIRNELAYIPTFHPELSGDGAVVISYNVDTTDALPALVRHVHDDQPRFVRLIADPEGDSGPATITIDATAPSTSTLRR
jgi:hypothetical protein